MNRATVIRIHGDPDLGAAILDGMQSEKLRRLEARLGVQSYGISRRNLSRIAELDRRYPDCQHSEIYNRFWSRVGSLWLRLTQK